MKRKRKIKRAKETTTFAFIKISRSKKPAFLWYNR